MPEVVATGFLLTTRHRPGIWAPMPSRHNAVSLNTQQVKLLTMAQ
jgi:hypothetical protein